MTPLDLLARAEGIARYAHLGQTDRFDTSEPYIRHIERVVSSLHRPADQVIAWLHDVIEDSEITAHSLAADGFPPYIVSAVTLLTRSNGQRYDACIQTILDSRDPFARRVKIADIRDHLRPETLHRLPHHLLARYVAGLLALTEDQ